MNKTIVYDKVAWHYPEGRDCPDLQTAKKHFEAIMEWLSTHGLLSPLGTEALEFGIDSDFALTSEMLSVRGKALLDRHYKTWLNGLKYGEKPNTRFWDELWA